MIINWLLVEDKYASTDIVNLNLKLSFVFLPHKVKGIL